MIELSDILFYSGVFNPIHNGHIGVALNVKSELHLKKVILVPTYAPYHKKSESETDFETRAEICKLAINGLEGFEVSDIDKRANKSASYSYNTVKLFLKEFYKNKDSGNYKFEKLNFLIGADAFRAIAKWYKIEDLIKIVRFVVVTRPGNEEIGLIATKYLKGLINLDYIEFSENFDISSSRIRELIREERSISSYIPPLAENYILTHDLYRWIKK